MSTILKIIHRKKLTAEITNIETLHQQTKLDVRMGIERLAGILTKNGKHSAVKSCFKTKFYQKTFEKITVPTMSKGPSQNYQKHSRKAGLSPNFDSRRKSVYILTYSQLMNLLYRQSYWRRSDTVQPTHLTSRFKLNFISTFYPNSSSKLNSFFLLTRMNNCI